ncbi:hypothetical protein ACHWQZ_G011124 [Mnemiopsis leidyi]
MSHSSSEEEIKVINDQLAYLTEEIAYLKGEDIGLIKRLIQLHIMISRQKREDARIAALIEEEEEEEGEESRDTRVSLSSEPGTPGPYKYEEPSVDDVEREAQVMTSTLVNIITRSGPHPVTVRKTPKQTTL